MSAREEVLARIRGALGEAPTAPEVVRTYRVQGEHAAGAPELVLQLIDRLEDYRATVTKRGTELGWTVSSLCDKALAYGSLDLATCPRASLTAPPKPFHF